MLTVRPEGRCARSLIAIPAGRSVLAQPSRWTFVLASGRIGAAAASRTSPPAGTRGTGRSTSDPGRCG